MKKKKKTHVALPWEAPTKILFLYEILQKDAI